VKTRQDLCRAIYEEKDKIQQFVLLNVGATVEFFSVDNDGYDCENDDQKPLFAENDNLTLYVIDSHRPINLIKDGSQIFELIILPKNSLN
jgi:hypothetical protein